MNHESGFPESASFCEPLNLHMQRLIYSANKLTDNLKQFGIAVSIAPLILKSSMPTTVLIKIVLHVVLWYVILQKLSFM